MRVFDLTDRYDPAFLQAWKENYEEVVFSDKADNLSFMTKEDYSSALAKLQCVKESLQAVVSASDLFYMLSNLKLQNPCMQFVRDAKDGKYNDLPEDEFERRLSVCEATSSVFHDNSGCSLTMDRMASFMEASMAMLSHVMYLMESLKLAILMETQPSADVCDSVEFIDGDLCEDWDENMLALLLDGAVDDVCETVWTHEDDTVTEVCQLDE